MFKNKRNYYITYTIVFAVMAAAVYCFFPLRGKTFVWETDGWAQHYKALEYYGEWLRSIFSNLIHNHTFSAPSFHFGIGYGSDILTTLHYYVIGDPLTFFAIFVPSSQMVHFYDWLIILRLYLAGLAFSGYYFYMKDKVGAGVLAGALTYVFCGYALFAGVRHPYFLNPMIYFPLILWGVEKILTGKKPYLFIVSVYISAISNFYFFYMLVLLTIFYVLARSFYRPGKRNLSITKFFGITKDELKSIGLTILKIGGYAVVGVLMSAIVLVPVLILFFGDARAAAGAAYDLFYPRDYYEEFLLDFIAYGCPGFWTRMSYTGITLLAVFLLFLKRKQHTLLKAGFLFLTVCFLFPIVGHVFNGFSYVTNRWSWGYSLLVAYILAIMWEELFTLTKKERIGLGILVFAFIGTQLWVGKGREYLFILAIFCLVIMIPNWKKIKHIRLIKETCLILVIMINIGLMGYIVFERNGYVTKFQNMETFRADLENTEAKAVQLADTEGGFYRYSGNAMKMNASILHGIPNTQYHWSLSNGVVMDYIREMGLATTSSFKYQEPDGRAGLTSLAGVKYYAVSKKLPQNAPFGFEEVELADKKIANRYIVYRNKYTLPLGYTYRGYIDREKYLQMTMEQRSEAVLQGVVLAQKLEGFSEIIPEYEAKEIPYTVQQKNPQVTMQGNSFVVTKAGASVTLEFEGLKKSETYLKVMGLDYKGVSRYELYGDDKTIDPLDLYGEKEWNTLSEEKRASIIKNHKYWSEETKIFIEMKAYDANQNVSEATMPYATPSYSWYMGMNDFMINFRYSSKPRTSIKITFPAIGTYSFDELKVICQPMDNYGARVKALGEEALENVDIHANAAHATNLVTGEITVSEPKILCLAIPDVGGWTAYVDGCKTELYRANTMYMALPLAEGKHYIRLEYRTPGKLVGTILSLIGVVALAVLVICDRKGRKIGE